MAADVKARHDRTATIAFTLPISCQVCLGKVKDPVLCPNNHVFCTPCMEVWLQRNKQCPACRVPINPGNPVRKILGGLNQSGEDKDRLSNPDLRKARFDLLFKEYEEEFERLSSEVQLLRTENEVLQQQLQRTGASSQSNPAPQSHKHSETSGVLVLNKKLQDAQKLYEKVKSELSKVKQENNSLKDENVNLNRENQKLRQEIANRSPHRYGRYTVATLESKVKDQEREISQLNKALERSDKLIEELQREAEELGSRDVTSGKKTVSKDYLSSYESRLSEPYSSTLGSESKTTNYRSETHKRQLFGEEEEEEDFDVKRSSHKGYTNGESLDSDDEHANYRYKSSDSQSNHKARNGAKGTKRVTFDLPKDKNETVSFDLEMPSPLKGGKNISDNVSPSPVKGVLKNGKKAATNGDDISFDLSKPRSLDDSYTEDRRMSSSSRFGKEKREDDALVSKYIHGGRYSRGDDDLHTVSRSRKSDLDISGLSASFDLENPRRRYDRELDDTEAIQNELDDLDISITPDFTDCMKLLNRAEKKVNFDLGKLDTRDGDDSVLGNLRSADDFLSEYKPTQIRNTKASDLTENYRPLSRGDQYSSLPEDRYSSKYYPSGDYRSTSSTAKLDLDIGKSRPSGTSSVGTDSVSSRYQPPVIANSGTTSVSSRYQPPVITSSSTSSRYQPPVISSAASSLYQPPVITSASSDYTQKTDFLLSSSKKLEGDLQNHDTVSGRYSVTSDAYSAPSGASKFRTSSDDHFSKETSQYSSGASNIPKYRSSLDGGLTAETSLFQSNSVSTPSQYSSAASSRPLGQSVFSRSPSLDNLFLQSKSTRSSGSKFATAEDVPTDYTSRSRVPLYNREGSGRLPSAASVTMATDLVSSALPPKPVRVRSQSDLGTSVVSLTSTHSMGKGNLGNSYVPVGEGTDPSLSYHPASQYNPPPITSHYTSNPLHQTSDVPSNQPPPSYSSALYTDSASYINPLLSKLDLPINTKPNSSVTNSTGPMKATTGYSYTDFELGVNPRYKNKTELPVTVRARSNSLDIPVRNLTTETRENKAGKINEITYDAIQSQFPRSHSTYAYSSAGSDSRPITSHVTSSSDALTNPDNAYAVSLTGVTSRPVSMATNAGVEPSRYGSSLSSSTSYLASSLTSVTTSNTFSSARSTSAPLTASSSLPPTTFPHPLPSLAPVHEAGPPGYSYLSNTSSLGEGSRTDSFLPEPKKRLFDSTDDLDLSLSPIKATKKM